MIFLTIFKERSKRGDIPLDEVMELHLRSSICNYSDDFYLVSNISVMECIRPDVAEALARNSKILLVKSSSSSNS